MQKWHGPPLSRCQVWWGSWVVLTLGRWRSCVDVLYVSVTGGDLLQRFVNEDNLTESEAAYYLRQLLLAVEYMHSRNVIHLDLKVTAAVSTFFIHTYTTDIDVFIITSAKQVTWSVLFVCHSVSRITEKVVSRFHWNLMLWVGISIDPIPDTGSRYWFQITSPFSSPL